MVAITTSFAAPWLTLSCVAVRTDGELSKDAALQRAQTCLEKYGAAMELQRDAGTLRYRSTWWIGRSWLAAVTRGAVHVAGDGSRTIVRVQASLVPLAGWMVLFVGVAVASGATALLTAMLVVVFGGNALFVYRGLRSVAADALRL